MADEVASVISLSVLKQRTNLKALQLRSFNSGISNLHRADLFLRGTMPPTPGDTHMVNTELMIYERHICCLEGCVPGLSCIGLNLPMPSSDIVAALTLQVP